MAVLYGLEFQHQSSGSGKPHILSYLTSRSVADDGVFEVWNGATNSDRIFRMTWEGQLQVENGTAAKPSYSFDADKDSGRYMSGAGTFLDVVAGTAVGTWTAGKLTLVELQVDNLNINGNTISSTAGTDLLITPLSGQQIVLDATIVIDAGVVTGATSITSTAFVGDITGDVTGNADTATLATTVTATANNTADETVYPTFVDGATGTQGLETDTGLTYNPSSGLLTATAFAGALTGAVTGTADVATVANTVVVVDSTDTTSFIAMFDSATGSLAVKTDGGLLYNSGTGMLTATGFTGPLTGVAATATALATARTIGGTSFDGTANIAVALAAEATALETARTIGGTSFDGTANIAVALATLATTVTITDNESTNEDNAIIFTAGGDVDGGSLGLESDGTLTYNPSSGTVTATAFAGALTGAVTGTADVATVATTVTITDNESTNESNALIFTAGGDVDGGNIGLESDGTLTYNPSTGKVTATGFIGTLAGAVTGDVTGNCSGTALTVTQAAQTAITSVGTLTSLAVGDITSTGDLVASGSGPHAIGRNALSTFQTTFGGSFTSSGTSTEAASVKVISTLTGAGGDTGHLSSVHIEPAGIVTQTATESIGLISSLRVVEPIITDNLTGDITVAATVYIANAPTEGETNAALYVASGAVDLKGTLAVTGAATFSTGLLAAANDGAVIALDIADTASYRAMYIRGTSAISNILGELNIGSTGASAGAGGLHVTGSIIGLSTLAVTGATTLSSTVGITGVTTHGGNVVSDADSTDDLGTTGVRWANLWVDDVIATTTVKPGTLVLGAGSITDTSGAITFGNENLVTTGTLGSGALTAGAISGTTLSTTGNVTFAGLLGIGSAANAAVVLNITSDDTAGVNQYGININPTLQSGATTSGTGLRVIAGSAAASFTMPILRQVHIEDAGKGSGSTITTLVGLDIENQTTGGTNIALRTGTGSVEFGASVKTVGNVGVGVASGAPALTVLEDSSSQAVALFTNSHASTPYGIQVDYSGATPNNAAYAFFQGEDATAVRIDIWSNGNIVNQNGSYGTISDERLKADVVPAGSQWEDVKWLGANAINYRLLVDGNKATTLLGWGAQSVEAAGMGGLVEGEDDTYTLKTSIIHTKAVIALGEALVRIEALEAQLANGG